MCILKRKKQNNAPVDFEKVRKKSLIFPELLADRLDENFRLLLRRQSAGLLQLQSLYSRTDGTARVRFLQYAR